VTIPLSGSSSTPDLTLSSLSAGASDVDYVAGFTATVTQTVTTVTLTFPSGTTFQQSPAPCDVIRDDTTGQSAVCLSPSVTGTTVTLQTSSTFGQFTVNSGDYVTAEAHGVTSTTGTGSQSVALTSTASATQAGYTVSFIASDGLTTGGFANSAPSTVTITFPGASFPVSGVCDQMYDASSGQPSESRRRRDG
jgi:hypothetical protein